MRYRPEHAIIVLATLPLIVGAVFAVAVGVAAPAATSLAPAASAATRLPAKSEEAAPEEPEQVPVEPLPLPATFISPIADWQARLTKKPFGIHITPATSPVEHDRFSGYHVGADFETFAYEADIDVPVVAACDGPLLFKRFAKGYGGVAVQRCDLDGAPVTVIYGHLDLSSIAVEAGAHLSQGDAVGVLGQGGTEETDGVRKHLHLGVHSGESIDIRGYVQEEGAITAWLDARALIEAAR